MKTKTQQGVEVSSWDDLFRLYKESVPSWNDDYPWQSYVNWLRDNYKVPQKIVK